MSSSSQQTNNRALSEELRKEDRVLRRKEYLRVQEGGQKVHTKSLLIIYKIKRSDRSRLGIAVSKKYGKSVKRNRIKRVVREVFRRNRHLFPQGADVVVIPKRVPHRVGYHLLVLELSKLPRKGGG